MEYNVDKGDGVMRKVEEFVRRNLGDEVFERLIEPFCSGWSIDLFALFFVILVNL